MDFKCVCISRAVLTGKGHVVNQYEQKMKANQRTKSDKTRDVLNTT